MSVGGQKRATIHWIYNIKLERKWEHRIHLLHNCIIMVRVLITATRQQQRKGMCVLEREEKWCLLRRILHVVRVHSYLGRRVVKERWCIAGVGVWQWEGHRQRKDKPSFLISLDHLTALREVSSPVARPMTAWLLVIPAHLREREPSCDQYPGYNERWWCHLESGSAQSWLGGGATVSSSRKMNTWTYSTSAW